MQILKPILRYSNAILIFITLLSFLFMMDLFTENFKKAQIYIMALSEAERTFFHIDKDSKSLFMSTSGIKDVISQFHIKYTGKAGAEFAIALETLNWSMEQYDIEYAPANKDLLATISRNQISNLISLYQEVLEKRLKAFDYLFKFFLIGIFIQFVQLVASFRRGNQSMDQLLASKENLKAFQKIREEERRKIASFLHDSILQDLGGILMMPGVGENSKVRENLEKTIGELRNLTYSTSPLHLQTLGIRYSIEELINDFIFRTGIPVNYKVNGIDELSLDRDAQLVVYRVVQEALNNISKHAEAALVNVRLVYSNPFFILKIEDDGKGIITPETDVGNGTVKHMGLSLMEQMVLSIGGELEILSNTGQGTTVKMRYNHEVEENRYGQH